jgi:hypothetical protein
MGCFTNAKSFWEKRSKQFSLSFSFHQTTKQFSLSFSHKQFKTPFTFILITSINSYFSLKKKNKSKSSFFTIPSNYFSFLSHKKFKIIHFYITSQTNPIALWVQLIL